MSARRCSGRTCNRATTLLAGMALLLSGGARAGGLGADSGACPVAIGSRVPLSLARAVDVALCNNAEVRLAWATIRVRAAAVGAARAAYWPRLSVSASELNERTGYPGSATPASNSTGKTVYGSLDWRLFDFGGRSARYHAAESLLEAATASRDATIQQVLGAVVGAYFDAITAQAVLADKVNSVSVARATLESAERREAAGSAAQNDALQAKAAFERARLGRNRALSSDEKSVAVLVYSLGIPAGSVIRLPTVVHPDSATDGKDLAAWLEIAERRHPALIAARAAVQAAREEVISARSAGHPMVDFTANYYQNGFPDQGFTNTNMRSATVGITVTVPLFDGFLTHYQVEEANAELSVRKQQLRRTRQVTLMAVVRAYAAAQSALSDLSVSQELLAAARAAFESSQRRYSQGVADIVELLNAQAALADARTQRTESLAEWRSARLRLLAAAGVLETADFD